MQSAVLKWWIHAEVNSEELTGSRQQIKFFSFTYKFKVLVILVLILFRLLTEIFRLYWNLGHKMCLNI